MTKDIEVKKRVGGWVPGPKRVLELSSTAFFLGLLQRLFGAGK
jgi:hypothetical protein